MHLSATTEIKTISGAKNPAAGRRWSGVGDGVFRTSKDVGADYFSLALTEMPTMRGSL
jgi:hypothetical protein